MREMVLLAALFASMTVFAQDILVKKDGDILKVYNLEEGNSVYYYSLSSEKDAPTFKINKEEVFSVKKSEATTDAAPAAQTSSDSPAPKTVQHAAVTAQKTSGIKKNSFSARTPDGKELNYTVLSESDHTLAVAKGKYQEQSYVIPEFVNVDGVNYTVTEIADKAFNNLLKLEHIQFPSTLKRIGDEVFCMTKLDKIILPESIEELGEKTFFMVGWGFNGMLPTALYPVQEIYIPTTIKAIGEKCFFSCGNSLSPGKKCQAYFSSLPDFITESTCDIYGIDDQAVKDYHKLHNKNSK